MWLAIFYTIGMACNRLVLFLQVMLQDVNDPHVVYHFLYNGWLAKDVGDGHLWRELRAKKRLPREVVSGEPLVCLYVPCF